MKAVLLSDHNQLCKKCYWGYYGNAATNVSLPIDSYANCKTRFEKSSKKPYIAISHGTLTTVHKIGGHYTGSLYVRKINVSLWKLPWHAMMCPSSLLILPIVHFDLHSKSVGVISIYYRSMFQRIWKRVEWCHNRILSIGNVQAVVWVEHVCPGEERQLHAHWHQQPRPRQVHEDAMWEI